MDAVTYPQPEVAQAIEKYVIPVRVPFDAKPHANTYNVNWTPALVTIDSEGKEHHRTLGFLPPEDLIASILLGVAKNAFDKGDLDKALGLFDKVVADYPNGQFTPEATYLRGVARFKAGHDPRHLKAVYEELTQKHPGSDWEKRAYPYRLL